MRKTERCVKNQLTGEIVVAVVQIYLHKLVDNLIIHRGRYRETSIACDTGMQKLHVMLESATFDHLSDETFALRFGILSHADKEEQAARDDGNDDNKENQGLPTLP